MLYPNYDAITTKEIETLDPHSLVMQLKDVSETLNEREEELYLWRQKQDQYAEALSFNSMLEDELSRTNEQILDLKSKVKNFIKREQVLLKEFSVDTHIQESYTTLLTATEPALEDADAGATSLLVPKLARKARAQIKHFLTTRTRILLCADLLS